MSRLVVGYPAALPVAADGGVLIDEKLRSGVARYREHWPGSDVVLAAPHTVETSTPGLGARLRHRDELGFDLVTADTWRGALDDAAGDLHLLPLIHRLHEVEHLIDRSVLTIEFTPEDLSTTERRGSPGFMSRARVELGSLRRRRTFEAWVRRARGVQCNGYPAYDRFRRLSPSAVLFFDTRLTIDHVHRAREKGRAAPRPPFRLCFSGRLIDAKGPQHAVAAVERLHAEGFECTLDVIGVGPLEQELRRTASPHIRFREGMDFASGWTAYVRDEVDLMVLPHTQGDPSGTYLEAAGCGVPVVGFDNVALDSLVRRHDIGVTVPLADDVALARAVSDVLTDRARWAELRSNGLSFMSQHGFEQESDRRVEQLAFLCG
jgi:colanic acid/amylovoran biosynthesis glycosyltransferase